MAEKLEEFQMWIWLRTCGYWIVEGTRRGKEKAREHDHCKRHKIWEGWWSKADRKCIVSAGSCPRVGSNVTVLVSVESPLWFIWGCYWILIQSHFHRQNEALEQYTVASVVYSVAYGRQYIDRLRISPSMTASLSSLGIVLRTPKLSSVSFILPISGRPWTAVLLKLRRRLSQLHWQTRIHGWRNQSMIWWSKWNLCYGSLKQPTSTKRPVEIEPSEFDIASLTLVEGRKLQRHRGMRR